MKTTLLSALAGSAYAVHKPQSTLDFGVIPGEFVVLLHDNASTNALASLAAQVTANNHEIMFSYNSSFRGLAYRATSAEPQALAAAEKLASTFNSSVEVSIVEQNARVHAAGISIPRTRHFGADCQLQIEATWGLCRTAERKLQIDGLYPYNAEGEGIDAYIVDTGIYLQHSEFEGRAVWGFDAVDSPSAETDLNGHGTHVAGTVMSKNFGLAKKAKSVAVRVLDADGSGSNAGVMAGIAFVGTEGKKKKGKSVANLSLGGSYSSALNAAIAAVVKDGIPFVVAAGNEAQDSCDVSPASEPTAITVMASDSADEFAYFSNFGKCSNIIAPGVGITSTWIGSQYSINTISGTSMAAPHVAGVVAKMLGAHEEVLTPAEVLEHLMSNATESEVSKVPASTSSPTPNELLYAGCYEI